MPSHEGSGFDNRILVLAPLGRDAAVAVSILQEAGLEAVATASTAELYQELLKGAAVTVITEESLRSTDLSDLSNWLQTQPPWSDFPFILLTERGGGLERNVSALRLMEILGNVTFIERPFHPTTLVSMVKTALRSRQRQYEAKTHLADRIEAAKQLAESEEKRLMALESAEIGTWDYNITVNELIWDKRCKDLFGVPGDQEITLDLFLSLVHPDDKEMVIAAVEAALDPHGPGLYDVEYRTIESGTEKWIAARGKTYFYDGKPFRFSGTVRDNTEQKHAEQSLLELNETLEQRVEERSRRLEEEVREREATQEQLRQSQKMETVGQLTGGIAHDFNNLLGAVMGNLELLRTRVSEAKAQRLVENALQAVNRGAKLTSQLLAFSRIQTISLKPVDINQLIVGMNELLIRSIGYTIHIETHLSPDIGAALADANQLEMAILNLAINARDAMPDNGTLTIVTRSETVDHKSDLQPGAYIVISVSDTGSGMSPDVLRKAFEPFFTTKEMGKGTGLGLSQVYGISQQSGGTVKITSLPGEGTTVSIWLPVAREQIVPHAEDLKADVLHGNQQTILVIDDDADVRSFIVDCLHVLNYQVIEASNGPAALDYLEHYKVDAAIVDYAMPHMTGAEWASLAQKQWPEMPIIFATGYADTLALKGALATAPVIYKPFRMADLAQILHKILNFKTKIPISADSLSASHHIG